MTVKNAFELDLIDYIPDVLSLADAPEVDALAEAEAEAEGGAAGSEAMAAVSKRNALYAAQDRITTNFQVTADADAGLRGVGERTSHCI